jgi:anti-anti-sigma regulatory factor
VLRITISSDERTICFRLEGKIVGPWAREFELAWDSAKERRQDKSSVVDLSAVSFLDDAGKRVLARCFAEGAELRAAGPLTSYIVESIRREQSLSSTAKHRSAGQGRS